MIARVRQTAHKHTALDGTPRHGVVAPLFTRTARQRGAHETVTFARLSKCGAYRLRSCVTVRQRMRTATDECQHCLDLPQGKQDYHRDSLLRKQDG